MAQDENTVNQSKTTEHAAGANRENTEHPSVGAASFADVTPGEPGYDQTTDSQVATRVSGGYARLAKGAGIAVANLPAESVITTLQAAKGSLDLVTKAVTEVFTRVDGLGDAELDLIQVSIDQAQNHLNALLHTARAAQQTAHTDASKTS